MHLERLLADASGLPLGTSQRQIRLRVAERLNERHGTNSISVKGIDKWVERGSVPSKWLMRVCALRTPALNPTLYA